MSLLQKSKFSSHRSSLNVSMLASDDESRQGASAVIDEPPRVVNRNSVEEDPDDESDIGDTFNEEDEEADVISGEFEAFSDTDSEAKDDIPELGDDEDSDCEAEAELFDHFDEHLSPRRSSYTDILEAVEAVKLNYSFPFQETR